MCATGKYPYLAMASFYSDIIYENKKDIENDELKKAAKHLSAYYRSFNKDATVPPDFNIPANCCAYLYQYAYIYSRMVSKYFRKMSIGKAEIKKMLLSKMSINICCIGGGPGIEVVAICKALAFSPSLHNKVEKISVLDKFQGWEPFFNSIMSSLVDGKDKMLPETFFKKSLIKEFVQVDFQYSLSEKATKTISQADIVCMTTHSSEFFMEKYLDNSQVLGKLFKKNSLIMYIDKFARESFGTFDYLSKSSNFKLVLGPLAGEKFINHVSKQSQSKKTYGCNPHTCVKVSVVGYIKTSTASDGYYTDSFTVSCTSFTDGESIRAESNIMDSNVGNEQIDCDVDSEFMESYDGSEIFYSDEESESVHSEVESESVHSDLRSESVHSDLRSESVHSDLRSESVHSDLRSESVHSDLRSESMHSDKCKETMPSDIERGNTYFDIEKSSVHSDMGGKSMHFYTESEGVHSATKKNEFSNIESKMMNSDTKVVDQDLNVIDPEGSKINSGVMKLDIVNSDKQCDTCNKFTQTDEIFLKDDNLKNETEVELAALIEAISDLVDVIGRFA